MKSALFVVLSLSFTMALGVSPAQAKRLDLVALQGKYEFYPEPNCSLACPESINIVYDAQTATLQSEIFLFSNIGRKGHQVGNMEKIPGQSSYSLQWMVTDWKSDAVIEIRASQMTTTNTAHFPQRPEPLDPQQVAAPGVPYGTGVPPVLWDYSSHLITKLKYDKKNKIVRKTVEIDGHDMGQSCAYQAAQQ